MTNWSRVLGFAVISGGVGSAVSSVALGLLARAEGKAVLQPVNATSHWLNGPAAGACTRADAAHTATGYATHHAATLFWAVIFERWIAPRRPLAVLPMLRDAVAVSALAAAVDYGATPKRFTPGWELVLTRYSMAVAYAAMAVGLAAGALIPQRTRRDF